MASRDERLEGLDTLKGLAIVLVVAIHAAPSAAPAYHEHVLNGPARLAVPLFFSVSGFLIGMRWPPQARLAGYFRRFLGLHLLYGALYWALEPLRLGSYAPVTLKSALLHFAAHAYPGQFFLFALPQLYFLLAFVVPERARSGTALLAGSLALATATVGWISVDFAAGVAGPLERIVTGNLRVSACLWLFPFTLGIWLGRRLGVLAPTRGGIAAALLLAALAIAISAFDLPRTVAPADVRHLAYARWSILIGSALLALALPWAAASLRVAPLASLGRESFGIFVLNPLIISVLTRAAGMPETVAESLLLTAATLGLAFALTRWLRPRIPFAFP